VQASGLHFLPFLSRCRPFRQPSRPAPARSWYGPGEPKLCFIERKTHRESWKGEKSVKERFTLPEPKARKQEGRKAVRGGRASPPSCSGHAPLHASSAVRLSCTASPTPMWLL
jgi:hypothetical protein